MRKKKQFLTILIVVATFLAISATPKEIVVHSNGHSHGNDQIYVEPPVVTYDDDLNELHVYFGSASSINIEYTDPSGMPYYFVYGENHPGYTAGSILTTLHNYTSSSIMTEVNNIYLN